MNLRSVDLNLLVVLDALLDEAHVSRAADRLGLSQPATSSALERCRHLLNDPLLERGKGGMRLTAKAESLREPLKNLLADVVSVLDPPDIDIAALRQTVRIIMGDYPTMVIAAELHQQLAMKAPGVNLVIQPWHGADEALDELAKGSVDLAVSVFPKSDVSFQRHDLLFQNYLVVMRKEHPAARDFNLEQWLAYPHILVSGRGDTKGPLDEALAVLGKQRRVGVVVPSFVIVPPLLMGSDLIAMVPSLCIPQSSVKDYAVFEPPVPVDGFTLHIAWHVRRDKDPGVQLVASVIRNTLQKLDVQTGR
ncbi:LysR family transcriptional regulator [Phyllobacterium sp. YR531]|uniref:LysR family transcriptional regulator n=1 Tax=Phyllobacterium sp. YR531 TaxID=1144343 RepID=UPI00026F640E|nr:LysR family transcriptional regulator [Phyllobacterium sp. YR531]EJN04526.1 transcriptional regulator [Phyllobacterium sp. YR531]